MNLTQKMLKELLHYDPDTGIFTWKERPIEMFSHCKNSKQSRGTWNTRYYGKIAGTKLKDKTNIYIRIKITLNRKRKSYLAHRLSFLYMIDSFPLLGIDHLDGNGMNNKWNNLEQKSNSDNLKNSRMSSNNTSGFNGISWNKERKKWRVQIKNNNKIIHGGYFSNINDAIKKRKELNTEYGFTERHGK